MNMSPTNIMRYVNKKNATKITIFIILILVFISFLLVNFCCQSKFTQRKNLNNIILNKQIIIFTIENRVLSLLLEHNTNVQAYANMHGYTYHFFDTYKNELQLPVYWWKVQKMLEYIETSNLDYVMWMDSDTIVCQNTFRLEELISTSPESSIFIARHYIGYMLHNIPTDMNAGVFIVKNNQIGKQFLQECIHVYINNPKCKVDDKLVLNNAWAGECYEQGVMNQLLCGKYKKDVHVLTSDYIFNGNYHWSRLIDIYDTFILHCFGHDKEKTYNVFKKKHIL